MLGGEAAILLLLLIVSFELAMVRMYQVDEAQNVYMARVLGTGAVDRLFTSGQLFLFPLAPLARLGETSAGIFTAFRAVFWGLMWINLALMVVAAGLRLFSRQGLRWLLLAGTLAPWWGYGYEIRHDNILMLGLLLMWILARRVPGSRIAVFVGLGFLSLALQESLFKSVVYWVPLSAGLWCLEPWRGWKGHARLLGAWVLGAAALLALAALLRLWFRVDTGAGAISGALGVERFSPRITLLMLLKQAPLLATLLGAVLMTALRLPWVQGWRAAQDAGSGSAEALWFALVVLAFLVNPNPFPYNLLVLTGAGCVALLAWGRNLAWERLWRAEPAAILAASALVCLHAVPWLRTVATRFEQTNARQAQLMALAERFAEDRATPVFDNAGLVPTRDAPGHAWFVNMVNVSAFESGAAQPMISQWLANPPAVVLPNYRLEYLGEAEHAFLQQNYVPLAADFWVLGRPATPTGEGTAIWECLRAGTYAAVAPAPGLPPPELDLDGVRVAAAPVQVAKGPHRLTLRPGAPAALVRVPPGLAPRALSTATRGELFPRPIDF
jgi:hypothetical protein